MCPKLLSFHDLYQNLDVRLDDTRLICNDEAMSLGNDPTIQEILKHWTTL